MSITTEEWKLVIEEARDFAASWYGHESPGGGFDLWPAAVVAQSRGATFRLGVIDIARNVKTAEPDDDFSRNLCTDALDDVRIHMKWPSVEAYLRNMDEIEDTILKERNKK